MRGKAPEVPDPDHRCWAIKCLDPLHRRYQLPLVCTSLLTRLESWPRSSLAVSTSFQRNAAIVAEVEGRIVPIISEPLLVVIEFGNTLEQAR